MLEGEEEGEGTVARVKVDALRCLYRYGTTVGRVMANDGGNSGVDVTPIVVLVAFHAHIGLGCYSTSF